MKWEYRILKKGTKGFTGGKFDEQELEKEINELGRQEWELVAAFGTSQGYGATREIVLLFKKPY